ncbi:DDE Tnp 1 7 domain containing protein [Asbolus verrucosus]|uniref:DDE Tnp 1 7 domain containing protein n=1 Tax=Asbolus verrucosus TaxID=1661398 RepID=A0A482WCL1_ASBVE|nr:DDE Tnp 1 7 domain containing protein [Asbolus verrucosus]
MWCLCEPNGYLIQYMPYQGKESNRPHSDLGVGGLKLANRLQELGVGYTGTIMANRIEKCPANAPKIKEENLNTNGRVTVTAWNDNRVVLTVSICDIVEPIVQTNRWVSTQKKKVLVSQPHVIAKYNKYMGAVDRIDENIDRCRIPIRSKKWWWANFAFCIDTSVHNAWQIYGRNPDNKLDYLHFMCHIVQVYFLKYGYPPTHSGRGHPKTSKKLDGRVPEEVRYDGWFPLKNRIDVLSVKRTLPKKCNVNLHENCFKNFHVV